MGVDAVVDSFGAAGGFAALVIAVQLIIRVVAGDLVDVDALAFEALGAFGAGVGAVCGLHRGGIAAGVVMGGMMLAQAVFFRGHGPDGNHRKHQYQSKAQSQAPPETVKFH